MVAIKAVTTDQDFEAAIGIQLRVFYGEQGIPEAACHEGNDGACHVLAIDGEKPVATARLICGRDGHGELARVAVLPDYRKGGIGRKLVRALEEIAIREGMHGITLRPHRHLESFYARLGYSRANDSIDIVAGHELITMHKLVGS